MVNNENKKLFIKRKGFWDLPKGHLEKNEKNRVAAIREVEEECGVKKLKIERKLIKTYHTYTLKKGWVLKPTKWYLMSIEGKQNLSPQKKEGITHVKWASKQDEDEMLKKSFSSISAVIKKTNKVID